MEKVRAKFVVDQVIDNGENSYKTLKMSACVDEAGDGKDFTQYTPWGNLEMGIDGEVPAAEFFKVGDICHLEFIKVKTDKK